MNENTRSQTITVDVVGDTSALRKRFRHIRVQNWFIRNIVAFIGVTLAIIALVTR